MTPLGLRAAAGVGAHLVARPRGVLHAYRGPLTPSGRFTPRAARPVCKSRTRTLRVVPLPTVGGRRVCGTCRARLVGNESGRPTSRAAARELYADVTPFDLAVDAWRAEDLDDVVRLEWVALLIVGLPALNRDPVVAPNGKTTPPLDVQIAAARRRIDGVRDPLSPSMRAVADQNEHEAREARRLRGKDGWSDREERIARIGYVNATRSA